MFKIFLTTLVLTVFTSAETQLLKTGQTTSYDSEGSVITDGSVKDDGFYQMGKARSYSRSVAGVVTDRVTGLEWQDDYSDNFGNIIHFAWQGALDYCSVLGLDNDSWRLPSIEELETLVDYSKYDPSTTENVFQYISSSDYWSSTINAYYHTSHAWIVYFYYGYLSYYDRNNNKSVRCVRGGELESSSLSRSGEIVTDSATGLQWQDDETVKTTTRLWQEAIDYCENDMTLGGHNDWRMPNINELLSIVNSSRYAPAIDNTVFVNTASSSYWSSTTYPYLSYRAWFVGFYSGSSFYEYKKYINYVRCVRGGELSNANVLPSVIMYLLN